MPHNLTENQKNILKWIVTEIRNGNLEEEFVIFWFDQDPGYTIYRYKGNRDSMPKITESIVYILCEGDYLNCKINKTGITCTIRQEAYNAIDSDFMNLSLPNTQITVGAIIQAMSGGNVQAVGIAMNSSISQVVNDPELLKSQIKELTENLLKEVASELNVDELSKYARTIQELREHILSEKTDQTVMQKLIKTLGFFGDIEGTISLMTRVWPYLHPILLIIASKIN